MSSETYVYDDATGSTILSKIRSNTDFLHIPSKDIKTRDWEKERKRLISFDLHCATLGEYHRQGKIPRGLRCNLRPTLFADNEKYCTTFQKILNKCSFDIILLTIEYLQEAIKTTEEKITSIETQLTTTLNSTEFSTLKSKVDSILSTHQRNLEERKRSKFQRDTEDYLTNKVYRWEDPFPRQSRQRYRQTQRGNYRSGGSSPAEGSSAGSGGEMTSPGPRFFRTKRTPTRRSRRKSTRPTHDPEVPGRSPNSVINISDYSLSPLELKVLNMGLSFCPTPRWDSFQLERDLQRFYRSIRLKVHFDANPTNSDNTRGTVPSHDIPKITIDSLGLRNPSTFMPPKSYHAVETFISLLDRDIKSTVHDQHLGLLPVQHNLNPSEKQALDSLSRNKNIIIKPADKGGATVVMNRNQYTAEVRRQLSDPTTYRKLHNDPTYNIRQKITTILNKHHQLKTIDTKTKTYLINHHPVTPVLYILPKIHKDLHNPPGRPIVASTNSILNPLSIFLEKILTPHARSTKSFILDTGDFLDKIHNLRKIPPESILCTLDVNSLYTSIEHDKGIEAVTLTLREANMDSNSLDLCIDLLNLVLREKFFMFEDDFFLQICGTAMGSNVAPAYANLYMDHFERTYVYPNSTFQQNALTWYRYIDDIFCIWKGNQTSLQDFFNTINIARPGLSFTLIQHHEEIAFLDTKILKDTFGNLSTDLYIKPTDCNSLLLYNIKKDSRPRYVALPL
ncbi:unnamed protein product [Ranitomeya imitator]|uniref:Reverse transcriptase domain-containing protein n=1 Tax=Ranitomeya imitator TaxID=111125 RepID=A0ABN9M7H9_9NEOB|nr:unnamed protein product [Ranitomeya imitator]